MGVVCHASLLLGVEVTEDIQEIDEFLDEVIDQTLQKLEEDIDIEPELILDNITTCCVDGHGEHATQRFKARLRCWKQLKTELLFFKTVLDVLVGIQHETKTLFDEDNA